MKRKDIFLVIILNTIVLFFVRDYNLFFKLIINFGSFAIIYLGLVFYRYKKIFHFVCFCIITINIHLI